MGVTKRPSGVNIIGLGAEDLNEFKPVNQLKDLYIQLTADGATEESMDYLAYLKSYAEHNQSIGLPIMPNGVNVWISNNGKTSAVEADDLSLEDGVYTICGIKCTNGTWDFSDAGQSGGGSGGGGGGGLLEVANPSFGKYTLGGKSYNDVRALLLQGIIPIAHYTEDDHAFSEFSVFDEIRNDGYYEVSFKNTFFFESETADGALQYIMD